MIHAGELARVGTSRRFFAGWHNGSAVAVHMPDDTTLEAGKAAAIDKLKRDHPASDSRKDGQEA